jgi:HD-GYP domain-containing protein (c-di-GMP phosphodiesterase class II)
MQLPGLDIGKARRPLNERMLEESRSRRPQPLSKHELSAELVLGAALVAAVIALAVGFDDPRTLELGPAAALVVAFALAARVRFDVGPGYTTPVTLVLWPMLFELPSAWVPVAVALGYALAKLPDVSARRVHPDRMLTAVTDAWFAVGPAFVFAGAGITAPDWSDTPWFVLAFAAQATCDLGASTVREWIGIGVPPRLQLAVLARIWMTDALLVPLGLLAAFAADGAPYRALLVLPLIALLAIFAQEREANIENALQLSSAYRGTALLLGDVVEFDHEYTGSHSRDVVELSVAVGERLRLTAAQLRNLEFAALLHDVGKIAVPKEIINKPGPLDHEEWAIMRRHTIEGQRMLDSVGGVLANVGVIVRASHEQFDGTGYPDGLAGGAIPIEARICAVCDAFSAMTTDRPYREAMPAPLALAELRRCAGTQFDPAVVAAFERVIERKAG